MDEIDKTNLTDQTKIRLNKITGLIKVNRTVKK